MTYSESAEGVMICINRCMDELRRHSVNSDGWRKFMRECWKVHSTDGEIDAKHVMDWLGY